MERSLCDCASKDNASMHMQSLNFHFNFFRSYGTDQFIDDSIAEVRPQSKLLHFNIALNGEIYIRYVKVHCLPTMNFLTRFQLEASGFCIIYDNS